jgi:hypothetical protein
MRICMSMQACLLYVKGRVSYAAQTSCRPYKGQADDRADMAHRLAASARHRSSTREPHYPDPAVEKLLAHELRRRDSPG